MTQLSKYSRSFFDSLSLRELQSNITELEKVLNEIFSSSADFNQTLKNVVEELKSIGHNMYSLDYDSDTKRFFEVWGSNYHDAGANGLEIEFRSSERIRVYWITVSISGKVNG